MHVHLFRLSTAVRTFFAEHGQNVRISSDNTAQIAGTTLSVSYDGQLVSNGSKTLPSATSKQPDVSYKGSETYTLMLIDPDVPSPQKPIYRNL